MIENILITTIITIITYLLYKKLKKKEKIKVRIYKEERDDLHYDEATKRKKEFYEKIYKKKYEI